MTYSISKHSGFTFRTLAARLVLTLAKFLYNFTNKKGPLSIVKHGSQLTFQPSSFLLANRHESVAKFVRLHAKFPNAWISVEINGFCL